MEEANYASRILLVPELLELVLVNLDLKTLLVSASRVCRYWAATMARSSKIQQALFFQPVPSTGVKRPESFTLNPLLVEKFGRCFFDIDREYVSLRRADSFLRLPWSPEGPNAKQGPERSLKLEKTDRLESFTMSASSWRRMLVSQPPPPSLGSLNLYDVELGLFELNTTQIYPSSPLKGLTMGQLYNMVHRATSYQEDSTVWYRVIWDKAHGAYRTNECKEQVSQLLEKTNVVVEVYGEGEEYSDYGPWDIRSVWEAFRTEDCSKSKFGDFSTTELDDTELSSSNLKKSIYWCTKEDCSAVDVDGCGYGYDRWPRDIKRRVTLVS
ncbi:uncharacterized protein B0J16DRAFT_23889 [Fusarium flagelliforme]|uniref:F-box domain-containing protein n=1 Tax=Fusarium flagelliforme TaxID=2675880 RepID=A0A395MUH9_9HYPO|nr:uncharacterized protein B0J16DRAFT_23889 [Fusarium flagelliforme]KAH7197618.1 hypothetical protein B0J16DRAFT_23889 [Fusarium flagelliforme]RFN51576.1 hypothetical protein FIE12Z_4153 [Fusarium flagelliforme]